VALARAARSEGVKPMNAGAQQLRAKVEPPLAATRTFAAQVRQSRPTLLVLDDDAQNEAGQIPAQAGERLSAPFLTPADTRPMLPTLPK
jgi:hypothetical protein